MSLFGFGKKKEETVQNQNQNQEAFVKVLGSGCAKCNQLEANTKAALEQLGLDSAIDHVTDFTQIASYGVMSTPALVVNGKVVLSGRVPQTEELITILQKASLTTIQ